MRCYATGCVRSVKPEMLMCRDHWYRVPVGLRGEVWRQYRRGTDTPEYRAAIDRARDAVAASVAAGKRPVKP